MNECKNCKLMEMRCDELHSENGDLKSEVKRLKDIQRIGELSKQTMHLKGLKEHIGELSKQVTKLKEKNETIKKS